MNGRFPGGTPTERRRALDILRIPARAARNTALADLPAVVLADLLGLSISGATNWANHTKRNWTDYIAARTSEARPDATVAAESPK